ncbi:TPA: Fe-S cluster assembly ATPase SufC [Patescibacteria group bacterium]|uniref:FeS assembly ATPase SufC n=1 Tax=Candidatus Gottesmanbacteria bacterium GW2011_GWA1_43_11 TaxID=1618436 RepID=A0A0G1CFG3_9BACT|nr:MAG: FeS assembly ATPase SufC [Candidatus Gottesmanbacteria bacterium GW2011_GWA1_43_11]HCS78376.1 Fe-S cluster assembly ATPase SufC [Patescibacteria group bacterium]
MGQKKNTSELYVKNLRVAIAEKEIVHGIDLTIKQGELHVVMGPNGSGKSTLTSALMGHPAYTVTADRISLGSKNLLELAPHARAQAGLLLAFQNPLAVPGVTVSSFLHTAYKELHPQKNSTALDFRKQLLVHAVTLKLEATYLRRSLNDGFSGGEKKKLEMLQLLVLEPKFVILDEIDTGLDVDALRLVSEGVKSLQKAGCGILLITHYQRILNYLQPDFVHILTHGQIIRQGGMELVKLIEEKGYAAVCPNF